MSMLGPDGRPVDGSWELNILVTDLQVEIRLRVKGDLHVGGVMLRLVETLGSKQDMSLLSREEIPAVRPVTDNCDSSIFSQQLGGTRLYTFDNFVVARDNNVMSQPGFELTTVSVCEIKPVMVRINNDIALDWSDHALWWPEKNNWLKRTRTTLDQYGVQADAKLQFTPMHKTLRVQLPDLQVLDMRVDFSVNVFQAVLQLCKELGIRHPEELSLMRKVDKDELKKSYKGNVKKKRPDSERLNPNNTITSNYHLSNSVDGSLNTTSPYRSPLGPSPQNTLGRSPGMPGSPYSFGSASPYNTFNGSALSPGSMNSLSFEGQDSILVNSPTVPSKEAFYMLYRPKSHADKARINCTWMNSSRSLMEQSVRDNDFCLLKFKFFSFYDLNPKYDPIRINQIYEHAKWSMMAEEIDCTEEEMMMFAALQVQIQLQRGMPQRDFDATDSNLTEEDDIGAALKDLQDSLEGSSLSSPGDITYIPELGDYIKILRPQKALFTLKSYKRCWCYCKDTQVSMYRSKEDSSQQPPFFKFSIKGCEVHPDVNISAKKYIIKLFVQTSEGMSEVWLRFETEDQYCRWMAACKLASKGRTMADSSYETEVQSLQTFLSMQHPATTPTITQSQIDIQAEDYVAPRFFKKVKAKQLVQRITAAHTNVRDMSLMEAKMAYIRAWQALPDYGITYFIIKMKGSKKEELVGIANNRIIRMDLNSGDSLKTWRYNTLRSWHVRWEDNFVFLDFEEEKVALACQSADCKIVHEFIGGYIFLSMRSQDKSQTLDEELFHKLTGGYS